MEITNKRNQKLEYYYNHRKELKDKLDDEPETPQIIPDRLSQIDYI